MITLVTQNGTSKSQPGIFVAYTTGTDIVGAILSVTRYYPNLPNEWGGMGRSKSLDGDKKQFASVDEAKRYALEHGYLQPFRRKRDPIKTKIARDFFWKFEAHKRGLFLK